MREEPLNVTLKKISAPEADESTVDRIILPSSTKDTLVILTSVTLTPSLTTVGNPGTPAIMHVSQASGGDIWERLELADGIVSCPGRSALGEYKGHPNSLIWNGYIPIPVYGSQIIVEIINETGVDCNFRLSVAGFRRIF